MSLGRGFGRLWTGTALANLADGLAFVAIPLLAAALTSDPVLVAGLALATTSGQQSPVMLYVVYAAPGVLETAADNAALSVLPSIVPARQLDRANGSRDTAARAQGSSRGSRARSCVSARTLRLRGGRDRSSPARPLPRRTGRRPEAQKERTLQPRTHEGRSARFSGGGDRRAGWLKAHDGSLTWARQQAE